MARKYARDNRGRFASKGAGATARGSRLKTAGGNKRDGQTIQAKGGPKGTIGKPKGLKPGAAKTSGGKWMPVTNSKGQVVGMRDRTKPAPSAAAVAQAARSQRANRNLNAAMKREADGPGSKASRSASVAKRAAAIYAGKVDAKQKTGARLTKTNNAEALRKRVKKIKDNNAAKPAAKPAAKADLSQAAFERRAKLAEKRARTAEKGIAGLDRAYTTNRRAFRTADALRSAADSYASYARRGKNNPDFTAADLFKGRARRSTAPKLSRSEKAAATRRANASKRFESNVRRMEQARRWG